MVLAIRHKSRIMNGVVKVGVRWISCDLKFIDCLGNNFKRVEKHAIIRNLNITQITQTDFL